MKREATREDRGGSTGNGHVLDPNYQDGGYWGMRMRGGDGLAAYGMHRDLRRADLEAVGGFGGIHGSGPPDALRERYAREESGGIRDPSTDLDFLRDFNSRAVHFGRLTSPTGGDPSVTERDPAWSVDRRDEGERGFSEGDGTGFGENWGRGPVPGAR